MKALITALITLFILLTPSLVGAQVTATPDDCSSAGIPYCDMVTFEAVNDDGESVLLLAQRMMIDATPREALSTRVLEDYIDDLNGDEDLVEIGFEGTDSLDEHAGPTWIPNAYGFRALVGTSDLISYNQEVHMIFVAANDQLYVFTMWGTHNTILQYIHDVVTLDNMKVMPEDFQQLDPEENPLNVESEPSRI